MLTMDDDNELNIPFKFEDINVLESNFTDILLKAPSDTTAATNSVDPEYEQFLADVWVGIVLTMMVLSCVCFMCSCLVYHKIQQWKTRVMAARNAANLEANRPESELPSYTIASGLPTYEEALEQLKTVKEVSVTSDQVDWQPKTPPTPALASLSVATLFQATQKSCDECSVSVKS